MAETATRTVIRELLAALKAAKGPSLKLKIAKELSPLLERYRQRGHNSTADRARLGIRQGEPESAADAASRLLG